MTRTVKSVFFLFSLIFIFLGTADFFSLSGLFLLLGSLCLFCYTLLSGNLRFDFYLLLIVSFLLIYCLIVSLWCGFSINLLNDFLVIPVSFYLFSQSNGKNKKNICSFLLSFIFGYLLRASILLYTTILNQGFHFVNFLTGTDWRSTNLVYISRNGLSLFFVPFFVASIPYIFEKNAFKKWWTIAFAIVIDLIAIVTSMIVGNRAFAVCVVAWFLVQFFVLLAKVQNKSLLYILFSVYFALIILFILVFFGVIPIPENLLKFYVVQRFLNGGSNSDRMNLYKYFFQNFWRYPFGGMYNNLGRYLHNFYLDIYNFSGVVPFLLFSFFLIVFALDSRKVLNDKYFSVESETTRYVLWIFVGLFTLGMIEPLFQTDNVVCGIVFFCFGYMRGLSSRRIFQKSINALGEVEIKI